MTEIFQHRLRILEGDEKAIRLRAFRRSEPKPIAQTTEMFHPFAANRGPRLREFKILEIRSELVLLDHQQPRDHNAIRMIHEIAAQGIKMMIDIRAGNIALYGQTP